MSRETFSCTIPKTKPPTENKNLCSVTIFKAIRVSLQTCFLFSFCKICQLLTTINYSDRKLSLCKVHPRRSREAPDGEKRYSCTLSLTSALDGSGWSTERPGCLNPGTHCTGGWVFRIVQPVGSRTLTQLGVLITFIVVRLTGA